MTRHDGRQHVGTPEQTWCTSTCVPGPSRRQALRAGGVVMASGTLVACGGSQTPAADPESAEPDDTAAAPTRVALSDTPVGGSTYYPRERVIVVHPSEGEVRVYDATCTHEGCQVSETGDVGTLVCPCHSSVFASDSGEVLSGPASSPLTTLAAEVDGDDVVISG